MNAPSHDELRAHLTAFLACVDRPAVVAQIAGTTGADPIEVRRRLDTYLNEPYVALDLVGPHLEGSIDILEVGAGIGAFSAFLATLGHNVLAIEPAGVGFDFMGPARRALDEYWPANERRFLEISAEDLGPGHGTFDLAFSVHVLEHVPDVAEVIGAIHEHIGVGGQSVHICPNYAIPYDPHFGIPLVPIRPAATRHLLPQRIRASGLWQSINFVTAGQVSKIAAALGLDVQFRPDVMADMAIRVGTDPIFRDRHGVAGTIAGLVVRRESGRHLLRSWPARLGTPMTFTLSRPTASAAS